HRVFCSPHPVRPADGRPPRPAITTIYYLLAAGEHSRWHRIASDEIWHFYEGDALELLWIDGRLERQVLHLPSARARPAAVVPAGCWQAARPLGAYALVGCSVGPGFDMVDFELLADRAG